MSADELPKNETPEARLEEGRDFYWDGPYMVFTAHYLTSRGYCCKSGCRHCPYGFDKTESQPSDPDTPAK